MNIKAPPTDAQRNFFLCGKICAFASCEGAIHIENAGELLIREERTTDLSSTPKLISAKPWRYARCCELQCCARLARPSPNRFDPNRILQRTSPEKGQSRGADSLSVIRISPRCPVSSPLNDTDRSWLMSRRTMRIIAGLKQLLM